MPNQGFEEKGLEELCCNVQLSGRISRDMSGSLLSMRQRMSMEARMSRETTAIESGTTILSRVLEAHATNFTPEVAQAILQLKFDQVDIDRMHALAEKNRQGRLTDAEWQVLQNYLLVGHLLDLLHSKARLALKHAAL